ncbi:MAG: PSD1 and planctomycete cytochrome C domain-containing protein [Verrucomicrobiota bacterium]
MEPLSSSISKATPIVLLGLLGSFAASLSAVAAAPSDLAQLDFFEKKIRPVLVDQCYECHSETSKKIRGNLLLDSRDGLLKGGDSGPAIVPGNPKKSLLVSSIRHEEKDPDMAMPPKKDKLSEAIIADFEEWVKMGAPDPRAGSGVVKGLAWDAAKAAEHWAFKPVTNPPIPKTGDRNGFIQNPIDNFVLARLRKEKLPPSAKADKQTLIRRVTYDLTGLPPSADEVAAFVADESADAYEKLVDRLLASPQYGERWARHWMDIARYADTTGDRQVGKLRPAVYSCAWTYRDYLIQAFNSDLPYDRFLIEQIAADRLPETAADKSKLAAMGFLTIGKRFMGNDNDVIDDRIDVVTKGIMGVTGACARCHDHKFDPIPTRDYYALHGVFASSEEPAEGPLLKDPEANPAYKDYLAEVAKIEQELKTFERTETTRLVSGMLEKTGDYLLMVNGAGSVADSGKKGGNFRGMARDKGLKSEIAAVWQEQLKAADAGSKKKKDAVLGPWLAYAALPTDKFAERAAEVTKNITEGGDYHPVFVKAIAAKSPGSLQEVAAVYTEVFESLYKALGLTEFTSRGGKGSFDLAKTEAVLTDSDLEELRKAIFAPDSSMMPITPVVSKILAVGFTTPVAVIKGKFAALELAHAGAPIRAMSLVDKDKVKDSPVFIRGEASNKGAIVPRHFLTLLGGDENKPFKNGSGRLELAQAVASRENPLTARVIVNRFWQWHFGQGIVRTPSDFGTRSEPPTHPELIDWLANWFMDQGWSMKALNKLIVMSSTYQQDSRSTERGMAVDPTNQWLWRANVQRLDFEQVRDTLLSVSGQLDVTAIGGHPFRLSGESAVANATRKKYAASDFGITNSNPNRRTIYAMIDRAGLPEVFNTFDFANPDITTGERVLTTVPQQALFMMNSPFIAEQVQKFLERKDFPKEGTNEEKVTFLFKSAFQRPPTRQELDLAREFLLSEPQSGVEGNLVVSPEGALPVAGNESVKPRKALPPQGDRPLSAMERYTQVILLTNELMYLR